MGKTPTKKPNTRKQTAEQLADKAVSDLPDHSRGSNLSDFTKPTNKYGGLSPAEQKLLEACSRGEDCTIGDGKRPTKATKENEIRASFLRYLILGGCEKVKLHQREE